jgi:hypothetical protein
MAEDNGLPPGDTPQEQPQGPQDIMAQIRAMINSRADQDKAALLSEFTAMEGRVAAQVREAQTTIQANLQSQLQSQLQALVAPAAPLAAPLASLTVAGATQGTEFPEPDQREMAVAGIMDLLTNPQKLAETIKGFRQAFAKDDFALAREIAARNPYAIVSVAPDPLGGHFPDVIAKALNQGVQAGLSVRQPAGVPGAGGGLSPLAPSAPGNLPAARFGPSGIPSATPTPATAPTSMTQSLEGLSNDALDTILAQAMLVRVKRQAA